jgi:hypothetical protein
MVNWEKNYFKMAEIIIGKDKFTITKTETVTLFFYAVRSRDGKWLRKKGYMGGGNSWVDNITNAKIYGKPGPAKAQITFWANNYPEHGIPDLVLITSGVCNYLDQSDRVKKLKIKKNIESARNKVHRLQSNINDYIVRNRKDRGQIILWKKELDEAKETLDKLKGYT